MTDKAEQVWLLGIMLSLAGWIATYLPLSAATVPPPARTTNQSQLVVHPLTQPSVVDSLPVSVEPAVRPASSSMSRRMVNSHPNTMRQWDYPGAPSNTPSDGGQ